MNLEDIADDLKLDIFEVNEIVNGLIEYGNIKEGYDNCYLYERRCIG